MPERVRGKVEETHPSEISPVRRVALVAGNQPRVLMLRRWFYVSNQVASLWRDRRGPVNRNRLISS